jgi:hypothetical protein
MAVIVLALFLKLDTPPTPLVAGLKAVVWLGYIAIVGATLMLLLGLEFGGVIFARSSVKVICLVIFGIMIGACFLLNEAKLAKYPVMLLRLFHRRSNAAALLVAFLHALVNLPIRTSIFQILLTCGTDLFLSILLFCR